MATVYPQPMPPPLLVQIGAGMEPGNYAQQINTLGNYINDILRAEIGNFSNSVSLPQTVTIAVPTDLYNSVFNAYGTALNALRTRQSITVNGSITIGAWVALSGGTVLTAGNWVSNFNKLASLAISLSDALTVIGL
jgi:hypothetical protein